jgi:hypothetical protein
MTPRIAVFVDGDNMGASHAPDIMKIAKRLGTVEVARAYGDATRGSGWHTAAGYRFVHAGTGKNATDLLLCIEAMEVALADVYQAVVVATSDGDFTHLALRLRERGITAVGVGEAKAPKAFRAACSVFECLAVAKSAVPSAPKLPCTAGPADAAPSQLDLRIRAILADSCKHGRGMRIAALGAQIDKNCGVRISTLPEKTWRAYLNKRSRLYDLDPKGPEAKVRIKPEGFADAT